MKWAVMVVWFFLLQNSLFAAGVRVESYYGHYDANDKSVGKASNSLSGPKTETWFFSSKKAKKYKLGVLFPHMKDPYFRSVAYGVLQQAKAANVSFELLEAGGYNNLGVQLQQLKRLAKEGVDGIILASISYDKLDKHVKRIVASGIPVVEVINDIKAQQVQAKSLVSFFEMGYKAGLFVLRDSAGKEVHISFLPGPKGSGWAPETYYGFKQALANNPEKIALGKVVIHKPLWGDTGEKTQASLIKRAYHFHPRIDYLVGNAVMAQIAPDILQKLKKDKQTKVVATYIIPEVYHHIQNGKVAAAPSDLTVSQGRIAVDMMIRILAGEKSGEDFPFRSGPQIPVISLDNIDHYPYEMLFGPQSFEPVFDYVAH